MIDLAQCFLPLILIRTLVAAITFYQPLSGLFLLIIALPLPVHRIQGLYPGDAVFLPVLAGWLLYALFRQKGNIRGKKVALFFLPFLFIALCSKAHAGSILQYKGNFYLWFSIPAAYLVSVNAIETKDDFRKIVYSILSVGVVFSLLYIAIQFFFVGYSLVLRSQVIDFYFDTVATYLALVLLLCLGVMAFEQEQTKKRMLLAGFSTILVALFVTGSRWGMAMGLCTTLGFILFYMPKDKTYSRKVLFIFIACLIILIFSALYFFDYLLFQRILSWGQKSFQQRLDIWQAGYVLLRNHPFLGTGMGWYTYYTYYPHAHNIIMQVLFETGLLGLATFCFLIGALIVYEKKQAKELSRQALYIFYSIIAGFIFFGIRDMLDFTLDRGLGIFLGIMLALLERVSLLDAAAENIKLPRK